MPLVWAASDYKKGGNDSVESDEKEVRSEALLKPCKVCGRVPILTNDLYGMGDSVVYYVVCSKDYGITNNHGRPIRLYTCAEDAIKGWNVRGGE